MSDDMKAKDNPERYNKRQAELGRMEVFSSSLLEEQVNKLNDKLFDQMDLPLELTPKYNPTYAYPITPSDQYKKIEPWVIYNEYQVPLGKTIITFSEEGQVDIKVSLAELFENDDSVVYGNIRQHSVGGQAEAAKNYSDEGEDIMGEESEVTDEFLEKQQKLSAFLLELATGLPWDHEEAIEMHANYTADANDILRGNPHPLGLTTREAMNLDGDKNE